MDKLPCIDFADHSISRLVCGGNPISGFSHYSSELDSDMTKYYTMANFQALLDECWANGINTLVSRADRHQMRAYIEYRERGGQMNWIAQTASEHASIPANIANAAGVGAIAIYNHGSHTDNHWHAGTIDSILDNVKAIHDQGLPAGVASHMPEVIEYMEEKGWDVDFYVTCFYNLARIHKAMPATDPNQSQEYFDPDDPARMSAVIRAVSKPCIVYKILAAGRKCNTPQAVVDAFHYAYDNIKPTDIVNVGMFQKYKNQVKENVEIVRTHLTCP